MYQINLNILKMIIDLTNYDENKRDQAFVFLINTYLHLGITKVTSEYALDEGKKV